MIHYITTNGIGNAWVANELRVVASAGVPFVLHAMRKPSQTYFGSEWAAQLDCDTRPIYPLPWAGMAVSLLAAPALFGVRSLGALLNALFGERETLRGRIAGIAHFLVACHWARMLRREDVSLIHSQWIHSCGTIGMYAAWLLGVPFSFTGHATDLFRNRVALRDKIRRAEFIICISTWHREFYKRHGARDDQLHIAYCGIDLTHFTPRRTEEGPRGAFQIRASGRLVEKKGFRYLLEACKLLVERGLPIECVIAGSGPLEQVLREQATRLGLDGRVTLTGEPLKQEHIPEFMQSGDVYCLPCVWASDGDVDGLPQMLMEAMACGLPAISTRLVGIPDLVIDDSTGLLVGPENAEQLADAIETLMKDTDRAARLAAAGRQWVTERFDINTSLDPLVELFRGQLREAEAPRGSEQPCETAARPAGVGASE